MSFTQKKRVFAFSILALFAFSFVLSLGFVSAVNLVSGNGLIDPVKQMFTDWVQGNLSDNVAKYLFTLLLFVIIWAILDGINIFGETSKKFNWGIALIVSFLSVAYLVPSDLYLMLIAYGALGMTLGGIFPFLLLAFWSVRLHTSDNLAGKIFSKIIWIFFTGFLIWKLIHGMYFSTEEYGLIPLAEGWTYFGLILLSVLWITVLERKVVKLYFKEEIKDEAEGISQKMYKRNLADIAQIRGEAKALKAAGDMKGGKELEAQAREMEKDLGKR